MRKLLLHVLLLTLASCPRPQPGNPGVVQCGTDAIVKNWPRILPAVNGCLAAAADGAWLGCLLDLISPSAGITEDTVRCVVGDTGKSFRDAADHNPKDAVSARAAARAAEFNKGWTLSYPAAP